MTTDRIIIVGGCGHVGLPLGLAFASRGCDVWLVDKDSERIKDINNGKMPFKEDGASAFLKSCPTVAAITREQAASIVPMVDAVVLCVPTSEIVSAAEEVISTLVGSQLLVIRSTAEPGTTSRIAEKWPHTACCPERITQGNALRELFEIPQIVGGVTDEATIAAVRLFEKLTRCVVVNKPIEAELAKIFCNAYRYITFAAANEFWRIAQKYGADFGQVRFAMREGYARMREFPRAGFAGGPCLPKDASMIGSCPIAKASLEVNVNISRTWDAFEHLEVPEDAIIGILGMAFKPESDDLRCSPAVDLRDTFKLGCKQVFCTDPYVQDRSFLPLEEVVRRADVLIVGCPHEVYRTMRFDKPVFDLSGLVTGRGENGVPH